MAVGALRTRESRLGLGGGGRTMLRVPQWRGGGRRGCAGEKERLGPGG